MPFEKRSVPFKKGQLFSKITLDNPKKGWDIRNFFWPFFTIQTLCPCFFYLYPGFLHYLCIFRYNICVKVFLFCLWELIFLYIYFFQEEPQSRNLFFVSLGFLKLVSRGLYSSCIAHTLMGRDLCLGNSQSGWWVSLISRMWKITKLDNQYFFWYYKRL